MSRLARTRAILFGEADRLTIRYLLLGGIIPNFVFLYLIIGATLTGPDPFPLFLASLAVGFLLVVAVSLHYRAFDVAVATSVPLLIVLGLLVSHDDLRFIHAWIAILVLVTLLAGVSYRNNGVLTCMAIGFVPAFLWLLVWVWPGAGMNSNPIWYQVAVRIGIIAGLASAIGGGAGFAGYLVGRFLYHLGHSQAVRSLVPQT